MENDPVQLLGLFLQWDLEILLPKETRIRESRGEHAMVALDDRGPAVSRIEVGNAHECGRQVRFLVDAREIFLIRAHREHDHFARNVEEIGIVAAEQRLRPFGQAGILDHQALVVEKRKARLGRGALSALADQALALFMIDDHMTCAKLFHIVVSAADGDRSRMVETVPDGHSAGLDALDLYGDDLFAEDRDDAV